MNRASQRAISALPGSARFARRDYIEYYDRSRCHQSLDGKAPEPRDVEDGDGCVYAIPHVGGLHHEYRRAG